MKKYIVIGRPRAGSLVAEFLLTASNVEYEFKNISIEEAQQDEFKSIRLTKEHMPEPPLEKEVIDKTKSLSKAYEIMNFDKIIEKVKI